MNKIIHKIKGYLGYGVPLWCSENILYHNKHITLDELMDNLRISKICEAINKGNIKPKLRPLDSLTDEELTDNFDIDYSYYDKPKDLVKNFYLTAKLKEFTMAEIEYFHKNHIDYQDLIGQGLAVEKEVEC